MYNENSTVVPCNQVDYMVETEQLWHAVRAFLRNIGKKSYLHGTNALSPSIRCSNLALHSPKSTLSDTDIFHLMLRNHHLPKQFSPICITPTSDKQATITNLHIESYRSLLRCLTYSVLIHPISDRKCLFFVVFAYIPHSIISIK